MACIECSHKENATKSRNVIKDSVVTIATTFSYSYSMCGFLNF